MPNAGIPLDAYVVIDTNATIGICEFCCSIYDTKLFDKAIPYACKEIEDIFNAIRQFAINNTIYTTPCVQAEFKPENGDLSKHRGFQKAHCEIFKNEVLSQIVTQEIDMGKIDQIRRMQQTPRKLGNNLSALSNEDLSLAVLALDLAHQYNKRVYILVDEEDLRYFVSWMKPRPEVRGIYSNPNKIEAVHSLTYLDSIHRNCAITSEKINAMLSFQSIKQMSRTMLGGTTKGEMINFTYKGIYQAITESSKIKIALKEASQ